MRKKISLWTITPLAMGTLLIAGCATKGYVRKEVTPVDQKIDQVDQRAKQADAEQTANLNKTNSNIEETDKNLDATHEIATTAVNDAKTANGKADQNSQQISQLRGVVANIDDYKVQGDMVVVHFGVNKDVLTADEKAKLDDIASRVGSMQRYFITVEGYTDQTGPASYNDELSRKRADAVISYLVGSHDIPVYRIHMVGLGEQKLIDNGKGKDARAASRRVEIGVFTAPDLKGSNTGSNNPGSGATTTAQSGR